MANTTRIDGEFVFTATINGADSESIRRAVHEVTGDAVSVTVDGSSVVVEPMRKPGKMKIAEVLDILGRLEAVEQEGEKKQQRRYVTSLYYAEMHGLSHGKPWRPTQHQIDTGVVPVGFEGEYVCYVYE